MWELISFDYSQELSRSPYRGPGPRCVRRRMVMVSLAQWQTGGGHWGVTRDVWGLCFMFLVRACRPCMSTFGRRCLRINCAHLSCVWWAHPEPYNRLWQPGCIPPFGNENFLALVSGFRCGCGLRWAEWAGLVSLWCPEAAADRVKEPRRGYQALCTTNNNNTHRHK